MENKRSLYDILGIDKSASKKEIKTAYKKRAKETHPDKKGGDEEEFKAVKEAYEVLIDDDRRAIYDETGESEQDLGSHDKIVSFLAQAIIPAILTARDVSRTNLIEGITDYIQQEIVRIMNEELTSNRQIKKIEEVQKRMKVKEGEQVENVFVSMLERVKKDFANYVAFWNGIEVVEA